MMASMHIGSEVHLVLPSMGSWEFMRLFVTIRSSFYAGLREWFLNRRCGGHVCF